ncbi:maleylpyruvate isomerase family mycothiol-dependent enzyme [Nocardiopsis sp. CT-R113]|uniref:Maleylpyruvate isomerase family mycothiol-dependent enzyme n=1 Tax=Nocardiopsis codii TaxID=3065942 RepID=A0ABU7KEN3_9ACTN|nr:maleylpyruvate isomerase family mycothiol-dependent enzyme [Nocardiopsis sp. CT-R113]MEE2040696.1 maleylpyruvate isomerase family mycothiol-dependent enzyme [Nocardiopsis sp. CT-R113]
MDSARIYETSHHRLLDLAATLDEERWRTVVPACPDWTVRQVYAHLAGLCADVVRGDVTPPATDEVTARQVADRADHDPGTVLAEWRRTAPALLDLLASRTRRRYCLPALDVWHHENDIRGALGLPARAGDADQLADFPLGGLARGWPAELPPVRVTATDTGQEWTLGEGAGLTLSGTAFELARAVTGRRSADQILAMDWAGGDPAQVAPFLPTLPAPAEDLAV